MAILTHVFIALVSIASTTVLFFKPTAKLFKATYVLVGLTLISGTYLGVSTPTHLVSACTTGLLYITGIGFGLVLARHRFATQNNSKG